jgi:kynurenine formamidase
MDPPAHLFPDRTALDQFPVEQFIGKALVIDCRELPDGAPITMSCIRKYGEKAENADFLLFNLGWDKRWGTDAYFGDYPCIDEEVLDYIIAGTYKGIGFDVIGLDPIADENLTRHKKLFASKDIVNIENLTNLEQCGSDLFSFSCYPLKLDNCDGSPIRAVAWFE